MDELAKRIVNQAIHNGWNKGDSHRWVGFNNNQVQLLINEKLKAYNIYELIFSHDFAKAFWGEEMITSLSAGKGEFSAEYIPEWQYHLQKMVISPDPIKYLAQFL